MLKAATATAPPYLIDGLMHERSVNLAVGDSGIGKTPLLVSMAVSVASRTPFLGSEVKQGRVLYCDAEMGGYDMSQLLERVN